MNKLKFIPALFAFLVAVSSAVAINAQAALSTMKDGDTTSCPLGVLVQADTNCNTTNHNKGRCTVTVTGGDHEGTWNAFNTSNGTCSNALFIIN